jgi:hypothetical protein
MNDLFRHRGGAIVVAVVLSIAGWAIVGGVAYLLWNLFWAQPNQQNDGRGGVDFVVAVREAAVPPGNPYDFQASHSVTRGQPPFSNSLTPFVYLALLTFGNIRHG